MKETSKFSRRQILGGAAVLAASAATGGILIGRETVDTRTYTQEVPLTEEQADKQKALRELATFMREHTTSNVVSNFLSNASPKDIEEKFTIGNIYTYYGERLNAWQLRLKKDPSITDAYTPTISYVTDKLNPSYQKKHEEVIVFLDKNGQVRRDVLEKNSPHISEDFSEEEMKKALARFAEGGIFYGDDGWKSHYKNDQGRTIEFTKYQTLNGVGTAGIIRADGFASISVYDIIDRRPTIY